MVPLKSLGMVSSSHSIATMAVSLPVSTEYTNMTDTQPDQVRRQVKKCGVDTCGECGARAYNGGLGAEPPAGSGAEPLVRGLAFGCPAKAANLSHSPYFANSLNSRYL